MAENLPEEISKPTSKQTVFLNALFGDAKFDVSKAKEIAGFSPNYSSTRLMQYLRVEIMERCEILMALHTPKAVGELIGLIYDPTQLGSKEKLAAIKELMDRGGLPKTEKIQHSSDENQAIFILPPKKKIILEGEIIDEDQD